MSRSLYITCQDCKERLWIGQGRAAFYSGEPQTMDALGKFLFKHETTPTIDHTLNFRDDNSTDEWYSDNSWHDITPQPQTQAALNRQALATALRIVDSLPVLGHIDSKTGTRGDYVSVAKLRQAFTDYYGITDEEEK